ncbi:lantibiotic dehydratase [Rhabdobacter roseus]|uniref:Thiopeptide-type bacteriocin biosynthesis protein n=1 Tax=Rhabdobacter roseus TaxID=1655419 RepID=A0A840TJ67_9BACT|nr:lantibiotic dehydratase [Rhabdobacter roseus]MBB5282975.1 thiopeptide-type bacteriocin biosynthesis protein [Rhabdobacter roseus]
MSLIPDGFFLLRRPLLPLETLRTFHAMQSPELAEQHLLTLFSDPWLAEALFLASPGLYASFRGLRTDGQPDKNRRQVLSALTHYLVRLCTRATPFGLFAGVATGTLSGRTVLEPAGSEAFRRYRRLDPAALHDLIRRLEAKPTIQAQLRFELNSSLTFGQGIYRYTERKYTHTGTLHTLTAVEPGPEVERAMRRAQGGATARELGQALGPGLPPARARKLIRELIQAQLLESEWRFTVTGRDPFASLRAKLMTLKGAGSEKKLLNQVHQLLEATQAPLNAGLRLQALLAPYIQNPENRPVVQTDLVLAGRWSLSARWVQVLAREFETVRPLLEMGRSRELDQFRDAFLRRFEGQEVPLPEALDSTEGIGYGPVRPGSCEELPLLADLVFPTRPERPYPTEDALARLRENLAERAWLEPTRCVTLTDEDCAGMTPAGWDPTGSHPGDGLYWLGSLLTDSPEALDRGDFRFLARAMGGASGLELLGRFGEADPSLAAQLRVAAATRAQQEPEVVFAEIAHLPEPRLGNLLQRPHLTDYEIVYLGGSHLPPERRISPADLLVSVRDNQVQLRSRRLGKRVIPRLTTAHNFTQGLPMYRFLCDVAGQGTGYGWQWGHLAERVFLPRVQYGHWILARARWTITKSHFPRLFPSGVATPGAAAPGVATVAREGEWAHEWEAVRQKLGIPRYTQFVEGDRELLIDHDSARSRESLHALFRTQDRIRLVEFPESSTGLLNGFTHEIVLPFREAKNTPGAAAPSVASPGVATPRSTPSGGAETVQRDFPPGGGGWTYVKVYCGPQTGDRLLRERIGPLMRALVRAKSVEKWFFVRYADPEPHLRIRFYPAEAPEATRGLTQELHRAWEEGWLHSIQYDTYRRELERYPGLPYERTESLFHADSEAVISLLDLTGWPRWLLGLAGADRLLNDWGLDHAARGTLVERVFDALFREFRGDTALKGQLDAHYRRDRQRIESLLAASGGRVGRVIARRSRAVRRVRRGQQEPADPAVVASHLHLFFNRLFLAQARQQELVLSYYLKKYYHSYPKRPHSSPPRPAK